MQNEINMFILNMAVADLIASMVLPPTFLVTNVFQAYMLGSWWCHYGGTVRRECSRSRPPADARGSVSVCVGGGRGGWGKLAGGVKWPPPPVRHLIKVNEMTVVSGHLSSLEVTRSKISKSCPL